jgi:hypothetical protein
MTRIFIEGYELDLTQGLSNQITYAIDDLQNLDSKSTAFTKTIVLPGTANNNKLLGNIFEFNNANFYEESDQNVLANFNASVRANARIEVDGLQIMKGTLRLLEIIHVDGAIEYECAIFGELGGFISALGNLRLQDLDFSDYNHNYTSDNITASWEASGSRGTNNSAAYGSGYYYPLIDYGADSTNKVDFKLNAFRPSFFVKEYIDKMKQRVISEETKYKISKANIGRKISDETKYKISKAKKGKRPSDECLLNARIATSKKVINTKTNEIYDSATQLAITLGMNRTTLTSQLSGRNKNSTDYIYL